MSKTDLAHSFPKTVPKKYPRAPGDIPPPHKSAHNDILCTDSNGKQAGKTSPPGVPLAAVPPLFSAGSDVSALCIDRTGRGNNRIHKTPSNTNTSEETKARKQRKQAAKAIAERNDRRRQTETASGQRKSKAEREPKDNEKESQKKAQARELARVLAVII